MGHDNIYRYFYIYLNYHKNTYLEHIYATFFYILSNILADPKSQIRN